ncbi:hypothetical protein EE612_054504, partial [Oryza sativa]
LLAAVNSYGETPLLAAVTSGHTALASELLRCCSESGLGDVILKQDGSGCNALHHAIRCGHKDLALELIAKEPALSRAVNKDNESPMFIAMMRDFADIFEKLLAIPDSSDVGCKGFNALHAAVLKRLWRTALGWPNNKTNICVLLFTMPPSGAWSVLRVLLEHDSSLGYIVSDNNTATRSSSCFCRNSRAYWHCSRDSYPLSRCSLLHKDWLDMSSWSCIRRPSRVC